MLFIQVNGRQEQLGVLAMNIVLKFETDCTRAYVKRRPVVEHSLGCQCYRHLSYVSHHTAFEYYGTVDQIFYEVYVGSEMRFHDFEFDGYTYHYVKEQMKEGIVSPELKVA